MPGAPRPDDRFSWRLMIGGTSMLGGRGSILGTLIGALVMSVLINGLRILSVAQEWQMVLTGLIIILAVYTDNLRRNLRKYEQAVNIAKPEPTN